MSDLGAEAARAADIWGADRVYPDGSFMFHCHLFGYLDLARRLSPGARVLDLACGEGYGAGVIGDAIGSCVAIDLEVPLLAEAATRYPAARFVAGNALSLPFADSTFDGVAALQVIEHLTETEEFLSEIARVLKPDGTLYLATPNIDKLPRTATKRFNPHHLRDFTPAELRSELRKHFDDVKLYGQMLDDTLPRARQLLDEAQKEWEVMPKVERIEMAVHRLPGPIRVRLRGLLYKIAGIAQWPFATAESARAAIRAEDFRLDQPAEASGNTIAICSSPRK